MKSSLNRYKRVGLVCVALGSIAISQQSLAAGTSSTVTISNTATVNYQVTGVAQTPVNSNAATFRVDNKVNLTLTHVGAAQTTVFAGQPNGTVAYRLDNLGNTDQGYSFTLVNLGGDGFDVTGETARVSTQACTPGSTTAPAYVPGTDNLQVVDTLAPDTCRWVFFVGNTPVGTANGLIANVTLQAITRIAGTAGVTLQPQTGSGIADDKDNVDVVFADTGKDATETTAGAYIVSTAALAVAKSSTVISDPFNLAVFPKAIPGATMEYAITLTNTGGASASVVTISDPVPANTTFALPAYNGNVSNVSIQVGAAAPTFCIAEVGADSNTDGCSRPTVLGVETLTVGTPALTTVNTGGVATQVAIRFRVTIN